MFIFVSIFVTVSVFYVNLSCVAENGRGTEKAQRDQYESSEADRVKLFGIFSCVYIIVKVFLSSIYLYSSLGIFIDKGLGWIV